MAFRHLVHKRLSPEELIWVPPMRTVWSVQPYEETIQLTHRTRAVLGRERVSCSSFQRSIAPKVV